MMSEKNEWDVAFDGQKLIVFFWSDQKAYS